MLAARHWSPGVSWAVGRQCTVTCLRADTLELLRTGLDEMKCDVDGLRLGTVVMEETEVDGATQMDCTPESFDRQRDYIIGGWLAGWLVPPCPNR